MQVFTRSGQTRFPVHRRGSSKRVRRGAPDSSRIPRHRPQAGHSQSASLQMNLCLPRIRFSPDLGDLSRRSRYERDEGPDETENCWFSGWRVPGDLVAIGGKRATNTELEARRSVTAEARGDAVHRHSLRSPETQLPEFTQEVCNRYDRELDQHIRVAMRIVDGQRWHAGCLLAGTSQQTRKARRNEAIRK